MWWKTVMSSTSDSTSELCWLVRDGRVLASLEIPASRQAKARGLLGRTGIKGAMLIRSTRSVHTIGMKFDLDVAVLDNDNIVVKTLHMRRNRMSAPLWRANSIIEAEAGSFGSWGLRIGDELEIRE